MLLSQGRSSCDILLSTSVPSDTAGRGTAESRADRDARHGETVQAVRRGPRLPHQRFRYAEQRTVPEHLAAGNRAAYRLIVDGEVERKGAFSLAELRAMHALAQITRHDCVEGWSAIGAWSGVPLGSFLNVVRPTARARYVIFQEDHVACARRRPRDGSESCRGRHSKREWRSSLRRNRGG